MEHYSPKDATEETPDLGRTSLLDSLPQQAGLPELEYVKASESLSQPIERLFKVGGLILVFTYIGLLSMMIGYLVQNSLSRWFFGVGVGVTIFCLALFAFPQVYGPVKARRLLRENEQVLDSIQEIGIRLTITISDLQALLLKHSQEVTAILERTAPILARLPVVNKVDFSKTQNVNALIVTSAERSRVIVDDINDALRNCKVDNLRHYAEELQDIRAAIRQALILQDEELQLPDPRTVARELTKPLQDAILDYAENVREINARALSYIAPTDAALGKVADANLPNLFGIADRVGELHFYVQHLNQFLRDNDEATKCLQAAVSEGDIESLQQCMIRLRDTSSKLKKLTQASDLSPQEHTDVDN